MGCPYVRKPWGWYLIIGESTSSTPRSSHGSESHARINNGGSAFLTTHSL